ncbi:MAG: ABC transporter permease subunit [Chroococcidiopsidaceae cyanobacterium CP_BM_ER_R8_30]|nr:ABC transporter permease subunit [Chroococcidiopsidaceae cyanobacterium CP_BM_ER_R8_30]
MTRPLTPDNQALARSNWTWQDGLLILAIVALIFGIVKTAAQFSGSYNDQFQAQVSLSVLPSYTAQTLLRMVAAYLLSLIFTLIYAYIAYYSKTASRVLIPLLDILQSIPVLSIAPGVVLALIGLFPGQRIGVELASILLIFTSMTWNMTFSFYQSLSSIPRELREAAQVYRLSLWQRFWTLELPSGVIGLVWNSVMAWAGGWFTLIVIESLTVGDKNFTLPGLGSFLGAAANHGNLEMIGWGLADLIGLIILIDFFLWRPLIAWAEKFKFESVETQNAPESFVLDFLRRSPTLRVLHERVWQPLSTGLARGLSRTSHQDPLAFNPDRNSSLGQWIGWLFTSGLAIVVLWGTWEAVLLLRHLGWSDWQAVMTGAVLTALRVFISLILSLVWTVPVGVAIGRNPRLAQVLQPIVQIAASVPATALFPVLLLFLIHLAGGRQLASIILMMLGTMWYILFNVIAGAQAIPAELFEAAVVYKLPPIERWRTLILPGIFPYLITGIITAVGGAWNASIVSEYIQFQNQTINNPGLGSIITQASAKGQYPLLLAATVVLSILVVLTNRLIWRPLYRIAEEKYQLLV